MNYIDFTILLFLETKIKIKTKPTLAYIPLGKFWGLANRSLAGLVEQRTGGGRVFGVLASQW